MDVFKEICVNSQRCEDSHRPTNASFYGQINVMREYRPPVLVAISVVWVLRSNDPFLNIS